MSITSVQSLIPDSAANRQQFSVAAAPNADFTSTWFGTAPMPRAGLLGQGILPLFGINFAIMCIAAATTGPKIKESAFGPLWK